MKKIVSLLLCITMMMCIAPTCAFAMEDGITVEESSLPFKNSKVEATLISSEESQITPRANPKDLYYNGNAQVLAGIPSIVNVTPTKGRALRVWLSVKDGTVEMKVVRPGTIGYVTEFDGTYGTGDRDVETVANCNGGLYQIQLIHKSSSQGYNPISILIYETGG